MTNYPVRQADIERRLANMAKAPRCEARTRTGRPCRQAAVRGRARCRMHGGAKGRADRRALATAISRMAYGHARVSASAARHAGSYAR